jgi:hypothetical protein
MLTRRGKSIRIFGDPDNQRPDKWSSTVLQLDRRSQLHTPATEPPGIEPPLPTEYGVG